MTDILFVDVETTGLNPGSDSILQIGAIRTDPSGQTIKATLNMKVKPTTPVDPRAAAVNGYTPQAWEDAIEAATAASQLAAFAAGTEFAAHCVWFDSAFCEALLKNNGHRIPWGRRLVDTQTLAHLMRAENPGMSGTSLQACIGVLGGERGQVHDAMEDAEWARRVYAWAMSKFIPAQS